MKIKNTIESFVKRQFNIIIIAISPIIIAIDLLLLSSITELLRESSDVAVLVGLLLISVGIITNFFLFKFIFKQFKQSKKS
jgi:hypothetical protein